MGSCQHFSFQRVFFHKTYSKKILRICNKKPISLEVFADDYKNMKAQAEKINTWAKNIYVKVPVTNSKGKFMGKIINELNKKKWFISSSFAMNFE